MRAEVTIQSARLRVGWLEISFAGMDDLPWPVCLTDVFDIRHCGTYAARVPVDSLPDSEFPQHSSRPQTAQRRYRQTVWCLRGKCTRTGHSACSAPRFSAERCQEFCLTACRVSESSDGADVSVRRDGTTAHA